MIQFKSVSKIFNEGKANEVKALQNINLEVSAEEFVILVGANGSGKSTLMNALSGSFRIDSGSIFIENQSLNSLADYQRSKWIARIFQNPLSGTAPELSILDNFRLASLRTKPKGFRVGISNSFKKEVQEKIALLEMGLENKLQQEVGTLSGGQRQALTLVMAIMDEAKIFLMDEPSAALDPKSAKNLMRKAQQIIQEFKLTCLLVTHDLKDAHQYGNRIIQMREGKIIKDLDQTQKQALQINDLFAWFT
jgi:putative ABC transport system ATP-binding protein